MELVILGVPPTTTQSEVGDWLRDLAGVAVETARADEQVRAIPPLLYHALAGLLFSQAELWGAGSIEPPCAVAFVESADGAAFGWVGDARVRVLLDGREVTPRWVLVRDEEGREARGVQFTGHSFAHVTLEYGPAGSEEGEPPASIEADWSLEAREPVERQVPTSIALAAGAAVEPHADPAELAPEAFDEASTLGSQDTLGEATPLDSSAKPPSAPATGSESPAPEAGTVAETSATLEPEPEAAEASSSAWGGLSTEQSDALSSLTAPREPHPVARWLGKIFSFARRRGQPGALAPPAEETPVSAYETLLSERVPETPEMEIPPEPLPLEQVDLELPAEPPPTSAEPPFVPEPLAPDEPQQQRPHDAISEIESMARALGGELEEYTPTSRQPAMVPPHLEPVPPRPPVVLSHDVAAPIPDEQSPPAPSLDSARERLLRAMRAAEEGTLPVLHVPLPAPAAPQPLQIEREPVGADASFRIPRLSPEVTAAAPERMAESEPPRGVGIPPLASSHAPAPPSAPIEAPPSIVPAPVPLAAIEPERASTFLHEPRAPIELPPAGAPAPEMPAALELPPASAPAPALPAALELPPAGAPAAAAPNAGAPPPVAAELPPALPRFLSGVGTAAAGPPVLRVPLPATAATGPPVLRVEPAGVPPSVIVPTPPVAPIASSPRAFAPQGTPVARPAWPALEGAGARGLRPSRRTWIVTGIVVAVFGSGWWLGALATPAHEGPGPLARVLAAIGLGPARYTVSVESSPPGAWIAVDGKDAARRTPAQLELAPGPHRLTLSLPDLGSADIEVRGAKGDRVPVNSSLNGSLEILTSDEEVPISVALDGRPLGYAPLSLNDVAPGLHELQFSGPGMPAWAQTVHVGVRRVEQIIARPMSAPANGLLQVQATLNDEQGASPLPGAQVFVDGELRGTTPASLELPRGPHSIKVTYHGETAPVQVIDLPGGNQRFASFAFGLDSPSPQIVLLGGIHPANAQQTAVVSANLRGLRLADIRDGWLHVRAPEGLWRRMPMTAMRGSSGPVLVCEFPPSVFDSHGSAPWYVSVATVQGDEYFSELQRATTGGSARPRPSNPGSAAKGDAKP